MDIDRISYIFGSFSRIKRHNQDVNKRCSVVESTHDSKNNKIVHEKSRSSPLRSSFRHNSRAKSVTTDSLLEDGKFKCPICKNQFVEPRVLPCLHTFCLKCLENLERDHIRAWNNDESNGNKTSRRSQSRKSVVSFGNASELNKNEQSVAITCPTCGQFCHVPHGGVAYFPPNYSIQHQMVLATLNSKSTHLLCDLCPEDTTATSRCMDCAVSFCTECLEIHLRQKSSSLHEVLSLENAREKGITKIRRQVMCMLHPNMELLLFCSTCYQVVCQECVKMSHKGHKCEAVQKVARAHLSGLRAAATKAKALVEKCAADTSLLNATTKKTEADCNKIQSDVEKFIEDYIKSIEDHKQNLLSQIKQIREEKMQQIIEEKLRLQKKIRDARDIAYFLDEILNVGSEVEVLSFIKPVIEKIEACENLEPSLGLKYLNNIQFLPEEVVNKDSASNFCIYGVLTTQSVSAEHCRIDEKDLTNLRVGKRVNVILTTNDNKEHSLERGGEYVTAEIRHRDAEVSKSIHVNVTDRRDGTYSIFFVPDAPGKLAFIIKVNGEHIQGSPFPITIRSLKPHFGTYHCCSFCSSGGSKEASCGCEGKMPGGYKGCGHGHEGHPGKRHWSCCGNVLEHSECGRSRSNSQYQFTL
ncbi:hypothetical protein ABEB36_013299 [Hypothenemus hampei]|uniref:Tripartite motif-containing protein 45 n=1 Tax=Hypothenemus hampei TaxID=57062 RepID=A0ABD1E7K9_HYPHA